MYPAQTLIHSIVVQECPGYLSPVPSPEVFADPLSCQLFLRHVPVTWQQEKGAKKLGTTQSSCWSEFENRTVFLPPQLPTGSNLSVFF